MRNPKYTVALNFNMPIFNNIKKSDVITNFKFKGRGVQSKNKEMTLGSSGLTV